MTSTSGIDHAALIPEAVLAWFSQNFSQGVLVTDTRLVIAGWNKWLVTATGLTPESVVGRPLYDVIPSLVDRGFGEYYAAALNGEVKVLSHVFHRFIVPTTGTATRDAAQMAQSGQIGPLIASSAIVGTITVIDDVSDRVTSEARLRDRIAAAEAASRVKDEFLATLSHEIRTPLNAVLGWTRILRSRSVDEATLRRAVDVIDRNASAQLTLVSDMLDMARISSGKVRLELTDVDLGSVAMSAMEAVRPAADVKGVQFKIDIEPSVPSIRGDPDRLLQVVWNLVTNAVKFTDSGGSVTLRVAAEGALVLLTVSDTGQGIETAFLPQVFERFKQADSSSSRRHGGLGLGLALVKDLVQLHGGTVTAESAGAEKGTTFRVRFPAWGTAIVKKRGSSAAPLSSGSSVLNGVRVLIVEDDPDAAEIVAEALQHAAGTVMIATSVDDAMAFLTPDEDRCPHVVVTDIGMPARDGYGLLEGVQSFARDTGRAVPVIALTAYASSVERARALRAGFDAHLGKPFDPEALVTAVARAARV